jgi:hypothetical protein
LKPKPSAIPSNYPSWATWKSREVYLPAEFHSPKSFRKALSILRDSFKDSSIFLSGKIDAPLLLLGLIFREVSRAVETEPGEPTQYPQHLVDSPLGIREMNQLEEMITAIDVP